MSAIAASNVAFTLQGPKLGKGDDSKRNGVFKIVFGDGTLTYPSGGIPLSGLSAQGFPNVVGEVDIQDASNADGYIYKYDAVNNKIRIYYPLASHTHSLFLNNGDVADGATTRVNAGSNLLGANTGSDLTVAGVADSTGHGGVLNVASAAGAEVGTSFAPASATTLYAKVIGY